MGAMNWERVCEAFLNVEKGNVFIDMCRERQQKSIQTCFCTELKELDLNNILWVN